MTGPVDEKDFPGRRTGVTAGQFTTPTTRQLYIMLLCLFAGIACYLMRETRRTELKDA